MLKNVKNPSHRGIPFREGLIQTIESSCCCLARSAARSRFTAFWLVHSERRVSFWIPQDISSQLIPKILLLHCSSPKCFIIRHPNIVLWCFVIVIPACWVVLIPSHSLLIRTIICSMIIYFSEACCDCCSSFRRFCSFASWCGTAQSTGMPRKWYICYGILIWSHMSLCVCVCVFTSINL